jgi:hypothetical protein
MEAKPEVFIIFNPEDREHLQELKKHLAPLVTEGRITLWDESRVFPGTDRGAAIKHHLESATFILLLVSASFMASDAYALALQALAKHLPPKGYVIPILLHPVYWQRSAFANLVPLPASREPISMWQSQHAAYLDVVSGIYDVLAEYEQSQKQQASSPTVPDIPNAQNKGAKMPDLAKDPQTTSNAPSRVDVLPPKALSLVKKLELVNILLASRYVNQRDSLETVLHGLNQEFPGIVDRIQKRSGNIEYVTEIISTCENYPGSLRTFCEIVLHFEGNSINAQQIRIFMQDHGI